mmetsp:Transcript_35572/g.40394  ORF Transcript_35572/g.40394 Transcript_35572/m.40394 type:complete len:340 (+) Transcript_35572:56-1075(+)
MEAENEIFGQDLVEERLILLHSLLLSLDNPKNREKSPKSCAHYRADILENYQKNIFHSPESISNSALLHEIEEFIQELVSQELPDADTLQNLRLQMRASGRIQKLELDHLSEKTQERIGKPRPLDEFGSKKSSQGSRTNPGRKLQIVRIKPHLSRLRTDQRILIHLYSRCDQLNEVELRKLVNSFEINQSIHSQAGLKFSEEKNIPAIIQKLYQKTQSLQTLNFAYSNLDQDHIIALSKALKVNTSIKELNLLYNPPGTLGCQALGEALHINTTLQTLDLTSNQIDDASIKWICLSLMTNNTLTSLKLDRNSIGDAGAILFGKVMALNRSIRDLGLSGE